MLTKLIIAFTFLLCFLNNAFADDEASSANEMALVGDWQGTLDVDVNNNDLRLVFHITKTKEGYSSTIESLDQGSAAITTEKTILKGNRLLITAPVIGAEYKATIIGDKITGIWSQYSDEFPELTLNRVIAEDPEPKNQEPAVIVGDWEGTLTDTSLSYVTRVAYFFMGKTVDLRVVFHIKKTKDGYSSTIDSLDQGSTAIPTEKTILNGNSILITSPVIGGKYEATISGDKITGDWSQYGIEFPELTLSRMKR